MPGSSAIRRTSSVGVYVGYDNPKPMGKGRTGGELAAPIVADFMRLALRDKPATPFRVPRAIELMPIDAKTGKRAIFGKEGVILEAFKPGDEPPEFDQGDRRRHGHRRCHAEGRRGHGAGAGPAVGQPQLQPQPQAPAGDGGLTTAGRRPLLSPHRIS